MQRITIPQYLHYGNSKDKADVHVTYSTEGGDYTEENISIEEVIVRSIVLTDVLSDKALEDIKKRVVELRKKEHDDAVALARWGF